MIPSHGRPYGELTSLGSPCVIARSRWNGLLRFLGSLLRRPFLLAPCLFFLLGLLHSVSLGALKAVVGFAHECTSCPGAVGLDLRKIAPDRDWVCICALCEVIQASAAASLSKLLTVVGLVSGIETFTPNLPASSRTIS